MTKMQESILTQQSDTLPETSAFGSNLASSHGKDFEKLFAENVNPADEKVTLSYAFLKALRERHAGDQKRIAELEGALEIARDALGYAGSVINTDGSDSIDLAKQHSEKVLRNVL